MSDKAKPGPPPSRPLDNPVADRIVRGQPARAAQASVPTGTPADPGVPPVTQVASPQSHIGTIPAERDARDKLNAKAKAQKRDER